MIKGVNIARHMTAARALYLASVAVLAAIANADPSHVTVWAWIAALVLTLPAIIIVIPLIFVVVPGGWAATDHFHVAWPTTLAYVVCLSIAAVLNVIALTAVKGARRQRQPIVQSAWAAGPG